MGKHLKTLSFLGVPRRLPLGGVFLLFPYLFIFSLETLEGASGFSVGKFIG
jgi:hypothetical protein